MAPSCCEAKTKDPKTEGNTVCGKGVDVELGRPSTEKHSVWQPQKKTAKEAEAVKKVYELFASKHDVALKKFQTEVLAKKKDEIEKLKTEVKKLGFNLNTETCHVSYDTTFKPIDLDFEVCYVRHGKTEGNTEPRIFQGFCDYWENQLNDIGKEQAKEAAKKMEETFKTFKPDLILCSPLGRAIETGEAFFKNHPEIPCQVAYEAREQQFGHWDNKQLRYMDPECICHLFYLDQNVLVKANEPHEGGNGKVYEAENFVELILRQAAFLKSVNANEQVKNVKQNSNRKANVLIYGHSMAGAAVSMLLGHGQKSNNDGALGFDGKYIMPNATPTMLKAQVP